MSDYVTWPELLEWAKAHGAKNERITSISIGTQFMSDGEIRGTVTIHGHEYNSIGSVYVVHDGEGRNRVASWEITNELLKSLPLTLRDPRDPQS